MKKLKQFILSSVAAFALLMPVFAPVSVGAQDAIQDGLCAGANLSVSGECEDVDASSGEVDELIATVINLFSLVVGFIAVIMIIIGGVKYITSGGDSGNVTGAKNTILYAVIGLVIVALAQLIVNFVLNQATSL